MKIETAADQLLELGHVTRLSIYQYLVKAGQAGLSVSEIHEINNEIGILEAEKTGNMFSDMEIMDKIHNLKMKREGVRPAESQIECVGCGS